MSVNTVKQDGSLQRIAGGTLYADAPIGTISPFGGSVIPSGYLLCNGQTVSRTTYAELFAVIGTAFGVGDGSTTFNVPDLREATTKGVGLNSKSSVHYDTDGVALGEFIEDRVQDHLHRTLLRNMNFQVGSENVAPVTENGASGVGVVGDIVVGRHGATNEVKAVGVNYIIKAKQVAMPTDFKDAIDDAMNECKIVPYNLNRSSDILAFNRKWLVAENSIVWTATHTGRLTIRCLKHGVDYSLHLTNQNGVMLDSYDNFFGDTGHGLIVSEASITLQAWVRKGDTIELSTNLPANTDLADTFFVQTGLLAYNDNFD